MKSVAAGFIIFAGREVVANFAGSSGTVCHELRTDCVVPISTGISQNTRAWFYKSVHMKLGIQKERDELAKVQSNAMPTC